jgi:hypothetical protein
MYEVVAVIGHDMAKRVLPGMDVQVRPTTVKKEQYGSMRGRVASITDRGVSTDELHAVLRNLELTKSLMNGASPLLAHIDLFGDPNTESGCLWRRRPASSASPRHADRHRCHRRRDAAARPDHAGAAKLLGVDGPAPAAPLQAARSHPTVLQRRSPSAGAAPPSLAWCPGRCAKLRVACGARATQQGRQRT